MVKNVRSPGIDCWSVIMTYVVNDGRLFFQCDVGLQSRHSGDKKLGQNRDGTLMPATPKNNEFYEHYFNLFKRKMLIQTQPSYLYHSVSQHLL